jgi:uncharacterized protein (TIGR00369 family)
MTHAPRDPAYEARIRASFAKQRFMATLGAELVSVRPGEVTIGFTFRDDLTQQHGFLHAGAVTAVVDSACGYAALSLMEPGTGVLAVEFKANLLAPAVGPRFEALGKVVRSGRTITVCAGELHGIDESERRTVCAVLQGTMMAVRGREGVVD